MMCPDPENASMKEIQEEHCEPEPIAHFVAYYGRYGGTRIRRYFRVYSDGAMRWVEETRGLTGTTRTFPNQIYLRNSSSKTFQRIYDKVTADNFRPVGRKTKYK